MERDIVIEKSCNVCGEKLGEPVFSTPGEVSITSLCELVPTSTRVFFCDRCGHVLTSPLKDIESYYSNDYNILMESEEEDQIVSFPDGSKAFRFDLQVKTIFDKVEFPEGAKVLDYGCAKSTTLKKMCEQRKDLQPYLFDVSENYIPFWKKFADPAHWAVFEPRAEWKNHFDVVTSFFSLEHVVEPIEMMRRIHALLKQEGSFYCIVPNTFTNTADFVVADHVNHFSVLSMTALLARTGFEVVEIDSDVHYGAFVIVAKKAIQTDEYAYPSTDRVKDSVMALSAFWRGISGKIERFEREQASGGQAAIYGSGFYGTFIASCLSDPDRVSVFIDQNPFRQGGELFGKAIVSPEQLPVDVKAVYVGLNPAIARQSIRSVDGLNGRAINFCYL